MKSDLLALLSAKLQEKNIPLSIDSLNLDGEFHYIKEGELKGFYIGSLEELSSGVEVATLTVRDWRESENQTFTAQSKELTKKDRAEFSAKEQLQKAKIEKQKLALQEEVAKRAREQWAGAESLGELHPYAARKLSKALEGKDLGDSFLGAKHVLRNGTPTLIIPLMDSEGKLWNLQFIDADGNKRFIDGGRVTGLYHQLGKVTPEGVVYICEGFATAATIALTSGKAAVCAFNAQNLGDVGKAYRDAYPLLRIVYCGDNDQFKRDPDGNLYRTGYKASRDAARKTRGNVLQVCFDHLDQNLVQEQKPTDFNDLLLHDSCKAVANQIAAFDPVSPVDYIESEHTGFHRFTPYASKPGGKWVPSFTDLFEFWQRGKLFRMLGESDVCYLYNGKFYEEVPDQQLEYFAQTHFSDSEDVPNCDNWRASEFKGVVHRSDSTPVHWFYESTKGRLNFQNGVFNLGTGVFSNHSEEYGFRAVLDYDYEPTAECPIFDEMMKRITQGDSELEQMLLEYVGYCFSNDDPWLQTALICVGSGANGKSTFLNVVRGLCGEGNTSSLTIGDLGHEYNRIRLDGKLCNLAEENNQKRVEAESFKNLVSGGQTSGRSPYKSPVEFRNRAKFILAFNEFDRSLDSSDGFVRRLLIANFDAVFSKSGPGYDPRIEEKLLGERSGIFNRCFKAYQECLARGQITEPRKVREAREEIQFASNPVAMFVDEHLTVPNGNWKEPRSREGLPSWAAWDESGPFVWLPELYAEYREWCGRNGYQPVSNVVFGRKLMKELKKVSVTFDAPFPKKKDGKLIKAVRGVTFFVTSEA